MHKYPWILFTSNEDRFFLVKVHRDEASRQDWWEYWGLLSSTSIYPKTDDHKCKLLTALLLICQLLFPPTNLPVVFWLEYVIRGFSHFLKGMIQLVHLSSRGVFAVEDLHVFYRTLIKAVRKIISNDYTCDCQWLSDTPYGPRFKLDYNQTLSHSTLNLKSEPTIGSVRSIQLRIDGRLWLRSILAIQGV